MFFHILRPGWSRIFRRTGRQARRANRLRSAKFRPRLETLEDRTVLSTVAYQVPAGTVGNQSFSGPLGMDFDVKQNLVVDELGVFDSGSDGLAVPLTARLYNRDTQTVVASLAFAAGQTGTLVDGSRFLPLATPVVLPAGFHGSIVAEGYGDAEPNGNGFGGPVSWTTNDGGGLLQFVGLSRFTSTPGAFPTDVDSGPANRYAAGTFSFSALGPIASGPGSVFTGDLYTLSLTPPQGLAVSGWTVNWGDGHTDTLLGSATQATHTFVTAGSYAIAATATSSALGALGSSYRNVVLADAPAAYWRLDETSPAQPAHDEVGRHDAAYQNFTAADLGQPGALGNDTSTSANFNGVDHYVSLPDVFNFPTTGTTTTQMALSFSAWFNTTTGGVILGQTDASTTPGGAAPNGWVPAVYVGTDGRVYASLLWHGFNTVIASAGTYNDGAWHQVADVYDNGVETLYVDGNAVASQAAVTQIGYANAYTYSLGAGYTTFWPNTNGGWSFFNGRLDEAAVYQGALSGQQVAAQFLSGSLARVPVTVLNATPTATLQGPTDGVRGQVRTFTFAATSPFAAEQAAGFTYTINWGDGKPVQVVARTPGNAAGVSRDHVYTDSGTYTVTVTATDQDGHASAPASQSITITPWEIQTQPDPVNPNGTIQALVVGGTTGADVIFVTPGRSGTGIQVTIWEPALGQQATQVFTAPIDRIVVYGQAGDDWIIVSYFITQTSELYGGDGNNVLVGGGGNNILVGGAGNDVLIGGLGRNLMIGGGGNDVLIGGPRGDILVGGSTVYDSNETALRALLAEWTSADDYQTRVARLTGTLAGGLNGAYLLNASTVSDDVLRDILIGAGGLDWFLVGVKDITDAQPGEIVTQV
jgi:hypothetical protein